MVDLTTLGTWIGVLIAAGGVIAGSAKFLFWVFDEWHKRKKHDGFYAPTETLRFALKPEGNCWWHMGRRGDEPTMQIVGRIFVTNISSVSVRIPRWGFAMDCGDESGWPKSYERADRCKSKTSERLLNS